MRHITSILVLAIALIAAPAVVAGIDTDVDGYDDDVDNCSGVANAGQEDADGDGFGNLCDADFDGNKTGGASHHFNNKISIKTEFGNLCDADFDGDCVVGITDFGLFKQCLNLPGHGVRPECRAMDLNSDHRVNSLDFLLFEQLFGSAPGPSGLAACE